MLKEFISSHHKSTKRDYLGRMCPEKPLHMERASHFGLDYWDGDRKFGYGGYHYDGRWKPLAQTLIQEYSLTNDSKLLDLGCGKAFILFEIQKLLPSITLVGRDISSYALKNVPEELRADLKESDLNDKEALAEFDDNSFDLTLSIMTLHNLELEQLDHTIKEIERVSKKSFIAIESYRNWEELTHLQCWALTCKSFFTPNEWNYIFQRNHFSGDFEFLYFT